MDGENSWYGNLWDGITGLFDGDDGTDYSDLYGFDNEDFDTGESTAKESSWWDFGWGDSEENQTPYYSWSDDILNDENTLSLEDQSNQDDSWLEDAWGGVKDFAGDIPDSVWDILLNFGTGALDQWMKNKSKTKTTSHSGGGSSYKPPSVAVTSAIPAITRTKKEPS